jgi:peptidoglycan hydrolase CwlO-like protein
MVAMVVATSTSFVSCKDTSEDVKTDLMAQVNAVKANLEPRMDQAETNITNLQGRMTTAEGDIAQLKTDVQQLRTDLTALEGRVKQNETDIAQLKTDVTDLQTRMGNVETKVDNLLDSYKNLITSVTVNATSTSILANSKLFPGINMQFLGAAYGKAEGNGKFPSTTTLKGHGTALEAADFEGVEQIEWNKNDFLPLAEEGKAPAGTVYFTVNPSNIKAADVDAFSLVNSQNEASFVTIDTENISDASTKVLEWSITRGETDTKLWEAPAIIDLKAQDLSTIDPTQIIDFKAVATDVRSMLSDLKAAASSANRNNYDEVAKSTAKGVLKNSAQIVGSLLNAKLPTLPALALKAQWGKDDKVMGERNILSDYSIAATAYKPLGFRFGSELVEGRQVSLEKINTLVARILNKIANKVNSIGINNITIAQLNVPDLSNFNVAQTLYFWSDGAGNVKVTTENSAPTGYPTSAGSANVGKDLSNDVDALYTEVNNSLKGANADIQSIINEIKSLQANVTSYADRAKTFEERVSDFLEREINRVITKVATDGLTRVLEPIILFQAGENYSVTRFFEGQVIPAGKLTLVPTTMTYEVLAPAYKKYVAIKSNTTGKFAYKKVLTKGDADFNKVTIENLPADNYSVIYSALDFSGVQISKKYNVTVK